MNKLTIIKVGGNVIDDPGRLSSFLTAFSAVEGAKVLIHGGGKIASSIGNKLGIESKYVDGRRITDEETLDLVTMVYGGLINKRIVATLQGIGCNAIGISGADGNMMQATKRAVKEIDYGYVGDITQAGINHDLLQNLLSIGLVPIVAPLTHDKEGNMLNTNADTIAQEIAKAMSRRMNVQLVYCFEKRGLLMDVNDNTSIIETIDKATFKNLKARQIISDGMIPKLENAFEALSQNVAEVVIGHADDLQLLISGKTGTRIK